MSNQTSDGAKSESSAKQENADHFDDLQLLAHAFAPVRDEKPSTGPKPTDAVGPAQSSKSTDHLPTESSQETGQITADSGQALSDRDLQTPPPSLTNLADLADDFAPGDDQAGQQALNPAGSADDESIESNASFSSGTAGKSSADVVSSEDEPPAGEEILSRFGPPAEGPARVADPAAYRPKRPESEDDQEVASQSDDASESVAEATETEDETGSTLPPLPEVVPLPRPSTPAVQPPLAMPADANPGGSASSAVEQGMSRFTESLPDDDDDPLEDFEPPATSSTMQSTSPGSETDAEADGADDESIWQDDQQAHADFEPLSYSSDDLREMGVNDSSDYLPVGKLAQGGPDLGDDPSDDVPLASTASESPGVSGKRPDWFHQLHQWTLLAESRLDLSDPLKALRQVDQILELQPVVARARFERALILAELGQLENSRTELAFAQKLDPRWLDPTSYRQYRDKIRSGLDHRLDEDPEDPAALLERSKWHMRLGQWADAEADLTMCLDIDDSQAEPWELRAQCRRLVGSSRGLEAALADLTEALALEPSLALYLERADCYAQQKQYQSALQDLRHAQYLLPTDPEPLLAQARLYRSMDRPGKAQRMLQKLLEQHPSFLAGLLERSSLWLASGQADRALADANKALDARPGYRLALYWRSLARAALGRVDNALEDQQTLHRLRESDLIPPGLPRQLPDDVSKLDDHTNLWDDPVLDPFADPTEYVWTAPPHAVSRSADGGTNLAGGSRELAAVQALRSQSSRVLVLGPLPIQPSAFDDLFFQHALAGATDTILQNPGCADAYLKRGQLHLMQSQESCRLSCDELRPLYKAINDFSTGLRLGSASAQTYLNRAQAYSLLGEHQQALEDLSQAENYDDCFGKTQAQGQSLTALMLFKLKQTDQAWDLINRSAEQFRAFAAPHWARAQMHLENDKLADAQTDLAMGLKREPDHPQALALRHQLDLQSATAPVALDADDLTITHFSAEPGYPSTQPPTWAATEAFVAALQQAWTPFLVTESIGDSSSPRRHDVDSLATSASELADSLLTDVSTSVGTLAKVLLTPHSARRRQLSMRWSPEIADVAGLLRATLVLLAQRPTWSLRLTNLPEGTVIFFPTKIWLLGTLFTGISPTLPDISAQLAAHLRPLTTP